MLSGFEKTDPITRGRIVSVVNDFTHYCYDFYGDGGLYDMGATREQIMEALWEYVEELRKDTDRVFWGDSVDRENVRDILMRMFNLEWKGS